AGLDPAALAVAYASTVVLVDTGTAVSGGWSAGAGSGFAIAADRVVTNAHVVAGSDLIQIQLADGTTAPATVWQSWPERDLAVLSVLGGPPLVPAPLAEDPPTVGEPVVAIGNALGLGGAPSVTAGIVSAVGRDISIAAGPGTAAVALDGLVQTD